MRAVQLRRGGRGPGVWLSAAIAVARSAPALALAAALLAVGCRADDEGGDELPFLSVPHLVGEAGVRVFTPEGEPLRSIGRRGEGPGEFRSTPRIVEWRDDALLAWDGFRQTWLDLEGNVLSTAVAPRPLQARVVRRTMEGDTIYQVSLNHRPVQLRAEVVAERVGTLAQTLMRRAPHLSQDAAQRLVRSALDVPEQVRPATEGIGVDDGGVWLRFLPEALGLEPPRVDETSGSLWIDLDPAGEIRAVVGLPPRFWPRPVPATDGAEVWGVFTGDFGVHQLARVRLRSAVGSELAAGGERDMALLRPSQDRAAAGSIGITGTPTFLVGRAAREQVVGWVLPGYDRAKVDAHGKVALRAVSRFAAGNPD